MVYFFQNYIFYYIVLSVSFYIKNKRKFLNIQLHFTLCYLAFYDKSSLLRCNQIIVCLLIG